LKKQQAWDKKNQNPKRWDERNKGKGWNYKDVNEEFIDFFDENDISEFTADDWDNLELEFEKVITMLNKGEKSGKQPKAYYYEDEEGGWWNAGGSKKLGSA